jgi:hypothetical protein
MAAAFTTGLVQLVEDKLEVLAAAYLQAQSALASETIHAGLSGEERTGNCIEIEAAQSEPDRPHQIAEAGQVGMCWNVTLTFRVRTHHTRRDPAGSLATHRARSGALWDVVVATDLLTGMDALAATAVGTGDNGIKVFAGHFGQRRRRMEDGDHITEQDVIIQAAPSAA